MSRKQRSLEEINSDLKLIISNKLSIHQSKLLFMGIIYEIILNKELFPKNSDLKEFINKKILKYLNRNEGYKDYVFKTRVGILSKIQKEIYDNLDYDSILEIVNELYSMFPQNPEDKFKKNNKKNITETAIDEWINFLKNRDK